MELLVKALNPRIGDTVSGSTMISASDYPPLAQFYVYNVNDNPSIEITGELKIIPDNFFIFSFAEINSLRD